MYVKSNIVCTVYQPEDVAICRDVEIMWLKLYTGEWNFL
jgi:hypothetical protein